MTTRFTLVRHTKRLDDYNNPPEVQATVQRVWDTEIDEEGVEMARAFAVTMPKPEVVVASPMFRCVQTAAVFLRVWGGHMLVDSNWIEVWHPKVLKAPLATAILRTDEELKAYYPSISRLTSGVPPREETRGIGGSADHRYFVTLQASARHFADIKVNSVVIVSHGDSLSAMAKLFKKEIYSVEYCASITADYEWATGAWTFVGETGVGWTDAEY
jgi:broad specificity phosphatase PhoE